MTNLHAALICQQLVARAGMQLPTEQLQALFRFAAASQVSVNMRRRRRLQTAKAISGKQAKLPTSGKASFTQC